MALGLSAVDAIVGALAAAFFGSIGAVAVILLNRVFSLQRELQAVTDRLDKLKVLEGSIATYGTRFLDEGLLRLIRGRKHGP